MAFQDQQSGDIHATLAVSQEEARFGSSRLVNLPGGRTTTVVVPAGAYNGQELRLAGQGSMSGARGEPGDLILRVLVVADERGGRSGDDSATERAAYGSPNDFSLPGTGSNPDWSGPTLPAPGPFLTSAPTDVASGNVPGAVPPGGSSSYPDYGRYPTPPLPPTAKPASSPHFQPYPTPPAAGQMAAPDSRPYPDYGGYPLPPQTPAQAPVQPARPKRSNTMILLILAAVVAVIAASSLGFYFGYYQPGQQHAAATQTAQTQTAGTTNAAATSTAQMVRATANAAATSTAQVQATAQVYQNIYTQATKGAPALNDSLAAPTLTSLWDIVPGDSANGTCLFTGGAYHSAISKTGFFEPCYALSTNYGNFAYQVDMTIIQGDAGGIILRANTAHEKFYLFRIGVNGSYALYKYSTTQGGNAALLMTGNSSLIKGLNQSNEITIVARQSTMYVYVNRQYLGNASDTAYSSGEIGVFAESQQKPTDAAFKNVKVWTL